MIGEGKRQKGKAKVSLTDRYPNQIAALGKVCADLPDAVGTIIDDLRNERRGWYHATLLCYCNDVEPWEWRLIVNQVFRLGAI